jgi:hypothetical protein
MVAIEPRRGATSSIGHFRNCAGPLNGAPVREVVAASGHLLAGAVSRHLPAASKVTQNAKLSGSSGRYVTGGRRRGSMRMLPPSSRGTRGIGRRRVVRDGGTIAARPGAARVFQQVLGALPLASARRRTSGSRTTSPVEHGSPGTRMPARISPVSSGRAGHVAALHRFGNAVVLRQAARSLSSVSFAVEHVGGRDGPRGAEPGRNSSVPQRWTGLRQVLVEVRGYGELEPAASLANVARPEHWPKNW